MAGRVAADAGGAIGGMGPAGSERPAMKIPYSRRDAWHVVALSALALSMPVTAAGARAEDQEQVFDLRDIHVVGSRRPLRSPTNARAPVDMIGGEDVRNQGTTKLPDLMRSLMPSYNVGTQPVSDEATFIRPANLRGLAADQTLVFVNGKRRHRGAVITYLGNGVSEGAQGPDIAVIPGIALDRVEVLRDTASAQYGSDAIAGVLNFVLRDRPDGGTVETQWGRTYEGDGTEYRVAANVGVPLAGDGFANLSAQWHEAAPTVRSVQRADAAALIAGGNSHVRRPYAQTWGSPDVKANYTVFVNAGAGVSERAEVYAFGNLAARETESGFFFRNPNTRNGVFRAPGTDNRLVGDLDPTDGNACPGDLPNDEALFDVAGFKASHSGCFVFNERFPGGFTPRFKGEVADTAGTLGFRGSGVPNLAYDVSYTFGRSHIDYSIRNTINPSLGPDTPTQFALGSYTQAEHTINFDLRRPIEIPAFARPVHAAAGVEWRNERFEIGAGERASWEAGPLAGQGFGVGANGYPGFPPVVSGAWDRSNAAAYVDLEAEVLPNATFALMGRVERYEDFGTTTDFKIGALYRANANLGLRGSAGTGFRAPTVGQVNASKITTEFAPTEAGEFELRNVGTLSVTCPEAVALGAGPLVPEEAVTFTAGIVAESGSASFTADVYAIEVKDRLGVSADKSLPPERKAAIGSGACIPAADTLRVRFFGNGFDTRTRGIDIVASVEVPEMPGVLEFGETEFVLAANWTETHVIRHDPEFLDAERLLQLEKALPEHRFNATLRHEREAWRGLVRLNYFGPYMHALFRGGVEAGREFTLDAEVAWQPVGGVELSVGANNIFDNYPDGNPDARLAGSKYPASSPMGFSGGFYYARARYVF